MQGWRFTQDARLLLACGVLGPVATRLRDALMCVCSASACRGMPRPWQRGLSRLAYLCASVAGSSLLKSSGDDFQWSSLRDQLRAPEYGRIAEMAGFVGRMPLFHPVHHCKRVSCSSHHLRLHVPRRMHTCLVTTLLEMWPLPSG